MNKINWTAPDLALKEILFVDGLSRSGKSLVGPIVSSFNKTYPIQHQTIIDNLIPLLENNSITKEACKTLINIFLNKSIYYLNLSRCINLRPEDNSSITKNKDYKKFLKNLKKKEGDYVIKEIKAKNYLPIFMSHDLLGFVNTLEKINLKFKIIYVLRHPIENIYSFYSKYDKRYKKEKYDLNHPRFFSLSIKKNNKLLPYYAYKNNKYFLSLNNAEKVTYYYLSSIKRTIKKYKKLKNPKSKVLFIKYDNMIKKHKKELKRINRFIKRNRSKFTSKALKIEKIPRKINVNEELNKKNLLKNIIRPNLFKELEKFSKLYEKDALFK